MPSEREARISAKLSGDGGEPWSSAQLCAAATVVVGVSGAGVMLMSGDIPHGSLCTTDDVSNLIEELQYTLGEGPCVEAHQRGRVVVEPDLAEPVTRRWVAFSAQALEAGARAVFAFPVRQGAARLGALNLYRDRPGPLSEDQHADAMALADMIAQWVLDMQAEAAPGSVAEELERGSDFHLVVHNAAGVVAEQLGVSVTEALIRLRAYAFSNSRLLRDVGEDIVERRLRF